MLVAFGKGRLQIFVRVHKESLQNILVCLFLSEALALNNLLNLSGTESIEGQI